MSELSRSSPGGVLGADGDDDDDDDSTDPTVLKAKQRQAWRSAGALQLRVEELTLEVTKVREDKMTLP